MPQRILRRTFSRFTWLKNRQWVPAKFPEMDRDWDFVHIPHLYRLHRAWDPFLFDWPSRAALATSDAQRALFYTTRQEVASDILPDSYFFLSEFNTQPDDKIVGDFQNDKLLILPENRYVRRPNGIPLAAQLAKINAFKGTSGYNAYVLQTAYLYEVALDSRRHPVSRRWLIRLENGDLFASKLSPKELTWIESTFRVEIREHPSPAPLSMIARPAKLPSNLDDYLTAVRVPELEGHPIEVLLLVLALGFTTTRALIQLRDAVDAIGPHAALLMLDVDPKYFGHGIKTREGRHAFRCIRELLDHVNMHGAWLESITGRFDFKRGFLPVLDRLVAIGANPHNYDLRESLNMAIRCDDDATGGALSHGLSQLNTQ